MLRYAITARSRFAADESARQPALLRQAARLAADGIDFVQLREKDLSAATLASLARGLLATLGIHPPAPALLINSRADIAIAIRAGGVHLPSAPGALTPAHVRALYAAASLPAPIVSVSCHTLAEVARAASSDPADRPTHILFGPVFEKVIFEKVVLEQMAPERPSAEVEDRPSINPLAERTISTGAGLDLLRAACLAAAPIPVLALGGVTAQNTPDCLAVGAAGVAAIRLFLQ